MLVPAILYKEQINKEFQKYYYTTDMMYETGCMCNWSPDIAECPNESQFQYAIVDENEKLIGYLGYSVDWYVSKACNFGLFSFDRNNRTIGLDVYKELKKIIYDYHIHRIEWRMIGGNPVEKHYDRFCNKYHGKKFVLTDAFKDRCGKYHDDIIYEIIFDGGENND